MKIKLLIVTVLIMFVTKVHSSQTTLVQKSAEFAKASEGFQLHLREKFFKSESIPFQSNQIHLEFGSQAPFKDYVLEIKKGNKTRDLFRVFLCKVYFYDVVFNFFNI